MPLGHTKTELYNPIPQEEGEDTEASNGLLSYPASDTECHQRHARDGISPTQRWLRLLLEISGLLVILVLIYCLVALRKNAGQASQRLLEVPMQSHRFFQDDRYVNEAMFKDRGALNETLRNWLELEPNSRGMVSIDEPDRHGLDPPYQFTYRGDGPRPMYIVSVFHQLHCLSLLLREYSLTRIEGFGTPDTKHVAHCFEYVRQALICGGDTTLEGENLVTGGEGWGTHRQCRDYSQILDWAGARPFVYVNNSIEDGFI